MLRRTVAAVVSVGARMAAGGDGQPRGNTTLAGLLLTVMVLAAYLPALSGGYIWDDDFYVTANKSLDGVAGLKGIWTDNRSTPQYYPLVFTGFWLEKRLWGLRPFGFHLVNVLLHALNALLLWRVLRRLALPGAWLAAAVFAVHPVQVESVAWITERKNVLSTMFYLSAMLAYFRFDPPEGSPTAGQRRWDGYVPALALFAGALLSKTVAASLPAALLLIIWWKRGRPGWREAASLAPMFAVGAGLALHTAYLEKYRVGTHGPEWHMSIAERVLIAGRAVWFYAWKIVWPDPIIFNYPRWKVDASAWWWWLFPACALGVAASLWLLRRRLGRGPLAAALFFGGTLLPAMGFVNFYPMRYSFVADHFQYLASPGVIVLLVGSAAALGRRLPPRGRLCLALAAAGWLTVLGAITWRQGHAYRDEETLWRDVLAKNPASALANNNLGNLVFLAKDWVTARRLYERALESKPDFAQAHYNLGTLLGRQGDADGAISHLESAIRHYPYYSDAYAALGIAYGIKRDTERARVNLEKALRLKPDNVIALGNLGAVYENLGRYDTAERLYGDVLRLEPANAHAKLRLSELAKARASGRSGR